MLFWANNGDILRLSPVISAYPDGKCEKPKIEVVLPGVEKKIFLLR